MSTLCEALSGGSATVQVVVGVALVVTPLGFLRAGVRWIMRAFG